MRRRLRARILWLLALGFATLVVGLSLGDQSSLAGSRGEVISAAPLIQVDSPSLQDSDADGFAAGPDGTSRATDTIWRTCPSPLAIPELFLILNRCHLPSPMTHTLQELSVCLRI